MQSAHGHWEGSLQLGQQQGTDDCAQTLLRVIRLLQGREGEVSQSLCILPFCWAR